MCFFVLPVSRLTSDSLNPAHNSNRLKNGDNHHITVLADTLLRNVIMWDKREISYGVTGKQISYGVTGKQISYGVTGKQIKYCIVSATETAYFASVVNIRSCT